MGTWTAAALSILAFFSPILMVIIPQMEFVGLRDSQKKCEVMYELVFLSNYMVKSRKFYKGEQI